ncbi:MAG: hypothetical protein HZB92_03175 [Euryarchaeota archaeon]|nr:hypothetical protein [Euryarchaeota archaeon]
MVRRTTQQNSGGGGSTPNVMEPISVDVMQPISLDATTQIGIARNKCVEILELCDGLDAQLRAQIRARVMTIRAALTALQSDVEQLMEIGEPVLPENQQWPEVFQAIQAVQALGHEARLMVVDWKVPT